MILRAAPDVLGAAGPAEHEADAPTLSETEEKPPAPASKKHSGDPETTKGTSASKKHANDVNEEKKTPVPEKPTTGAEAEGKPPASPKLTAAVTQKKKTSPSTKPTQKTTKTTASSQHTPKKPAVKKPAAKQLPKKKDATKETRRTARLPPKRTDVLLPGPHEEVSSDSPDTDTPNPALVTGADPPVGDASQAPRAQTSTTGPAASANFAITPPPKRIPSPDPSLRVDYEESEPDMDREGGEVEGSWSSPPLTDEQRVLHPGSPMSPKTVAATARARVLEEALSRRDDPPPATPLSQVITNAGVDEGVPPELLRPGNRQHLSDRSRQAASQPMGAKRERETPAPRTREQLLALRYWTREEYRAHATSPGTGTDRYAHGASIASRHGNRGRSRYQAEAVEPATGVVSDQDAQRRPTGSRPNLESLLAGLESCQRLLDGQRTEMVALRARVQDVETHLGSIQDFSRAQTVCETTCGDCLGRYAVLVTKSTACGTDVRKARRTTDRCAKT
ncbi:unnamed protein product [Phytophthora fragariaefolia]|uniref:Unnamed protein product n=1 Tax=Phytophthora fragariaefolia TaxID=1490495 RepID=A0A9W6WYY3_9STRA|nr:unnamed protein product [Phytophthora fragariaefolia]